MADAASPSPQVAQQAQKTEQKRPTNKNRKNKSQAVTAPDGTVSDSVAAGAASPRSKKQHKPRQSIPNGVPPYQNGQISKGVSAKTRPVSVVGSVLPGTPAKEQAYAGPTFHASPAPSALPMPKFFSRSMPKDGSPLQARLDGERTPEKEAVSPEATGTSPVVPREAAHSPLDMLFKADKAEREKRGLLSPEQAVRQPVSATNASSVFHPSGKSIFLQELDGAEDMPSPRTHLRNGRPSPVERAHSSPGKRPPSTDEDQRQAYTKSLKDLLFNTANGQSPPQYPQTQPRPHPDASIFNTPSPNQRATSGPSTPAPSTDQQHHYALHYGNRDLSPLFKAARNETPSRPSNLRQELPGSMPNPDPCQQVPPPRHVPEMDGNTFARSFLDQHVQTATPDTFPHGLYSNAGQRQASTPQNGNNHGPGPHAQQQGGQLVSTNGNGSSTNGANSQDGSDVLKRMLNLHVND
jgi:hypothetical protein